MNRKCDKDKLSQQIEEYDFMNISNDYHQQKNNQMNTSKTNLMNVSHAKNWLLKEKLMNSNQHIQQQQQQLYYNQLQNPTNNNMMMNNSHQNNLQIPSNIINNIQRRNSGNKTRNSLL